MTTIHFIPEFVAETAEPYCSVCGTPVRLYRVDRVQSAVRADILWSRICGDSANGYEFTHAACVGLEQR